MSSVVSDRGGTAAAEPLPAPAAPWRARTRVAGEIGALVGVLVVLFFLIRPMLFKHQFVGFDWYAHLWYIWHQEGSIKDNVFPSLFNFNQTGVFDPHYAFYGGTLYVITAVLALVVGHVAAFALTWIGAFVMAWGGFYWMCRMAGVNRIASHLPGVLFMASPWWLSSIYAWGSWGQAVAVSSLVLLLASAVSILRSEELRFWPAFALAGSTLLYTGSHNLTMLWATTLLVLVGVFVLLAVPRARKLLFQKRGLKRLALIMIPAFLVNAWFFLPDVAYQAQTSIAANADFAEGLVRTSMFYVIPQYLFTLHNHNGIPGATHQSAQLPLLGVAWSVAALIVFLPRLRSQWPWLAVAFLGLMIGVWQLMTHIEWIVDLPSPYNRIQAPYRFEAYIELGAGALMVVALGAGAKIRGWRRWWVLLTIPALFVTIGNGIRLVDQPNQAPQVRPPWNQPRPYWAQDEPPYGAADYVDSRLPSVQVDPTMPRAIFDARTAQRDHKATATVTAGPGQYVASNLKTATWLLKLKGATWFANDPAGNGILEVDSSAVDANGVAHITVEATSPPPVVFGRIITVLALLYLLGAAALFGRRARARRSSGVAAA
jgi:hypothetical protein